MAESLGGNGKKLSRAKYYQDQLKVGANISRAGCDECATGGGSIGVHVQNSDGHVYFITCKHVMDPSQLRKSPECCKLSDKCVQPSDGCYRDNIEKKVDKENRDKDRICGEISDKQVLGNVEVNGKMYFLDVCLVKINDLRKSSEETVDIPLTRLKDLNLARNKLSFKNAKPAKFERYGKNLAVYKVGSTSGLTQGEIYVENGNIYHTETVNYLGNVRMICNFIKIKDITGDLDNRNFARPGDSGSAVFKIIGTPNGTELEILGLVAADYGTEDNTTVVIPIEPILQHFDVTLCPFN